MEPLCTRPRAIPRMCYTARENLPAAHSLALDQRLSIWRWGHDTSGQRGQGKCNADTNYHR